MAEFAEAKISTVKMNIAANSDGYIAQSGETVTASHAASIKGIKATANLSEAAKVFKAFYGDIAGGSSDSLSAKKTIVQGVVNDG